MDSIEQFVEDMGLYFERNGLTRMAGRIIGWLMICQPPHQTMSEIVSVLGASKSSVSTALALLNQVNLIDRISLPGERRDYFRINPDFWTRAFAARASEITALKTMAARGLDLLKQAPIEQRRRLQLMYEMNAFMEVEMPKLIAKWNEYKREKGLEE